MIGFLKKIFSIGPGLDYSGLIKQGALILDVRTKVEYQSGHIKGSVNIPLDILKGNLARFKKDQNIICCCASGMRSASAKSILQSNGFKVINGGGWRSLENKIG